MFNLTDPKLSYVLINPEVEGASLLENNWNCERLCSVLYSKDSTVISLKELYQNKYSKSFIGIMSSSNNDEIRQDVLQILNFLKIESAIVKYLDQENPVSITMNGEEKPLLFNSYGIDEGLKVYIHEGVAFSFVEQKRYFHPKKKEHLKNGMVIEYFNNNQWNKKQILDLDQEFDKMYNLLIKYEKLRIPTN